MSGHDLTPGDWTTGPAKWFAVLLLGGLGAGALALGVHRAPASSGRPESGAEHRQVVESPPRAQLPAQPLSDRALAPQAEQARSAKTTTNARAPAPSGIATRVNINTASQAELELLPGIGPGLGKRIIDDREARGPFKSIEDLDRVKGIGPKLMAKLRDRIVVSVGVGADDEREAHRAPSQPAGESEPTSTP